MKKTLGGIDALYPAPTVIVGAIVDGKPNVITAARIRIASHASSPWPAAGTRASG